MALQLFKIETVEVASPVTSVTFSDIPQGYTDLILVASSRSTRASQEDPTYVRFNNNSSSVYSWKFVYGNGSAVYSGSGSTTQFEYFSQPANSATANTFGSMSIYIPNYTSSNYKSVSVDALFENNSTTADYTRAQLVAGLFSSTSAITSILIGPYVGPAFATNSTFTLYGVL
jgi:hypothetical protein